MSPKQITRMGVIVAGLSIIGLVMMLVTQPAWDFWNWWPAMGLAVAFLLFVAAFLKGAYLTAQKRAELVDKLNDCYTGNTEQGAQLEIAGENH